LLLALSFPRQALSSRLALLAVVWSRGVVRLEKKRCVCVGANRVGLTAEKKTEIFLFFQSAHFYFYFISTFHSGFIFA